MTRIGGRGVALLAAMICWLGAAPARAGVTITFWSHEFGNDFPHAFFTLRGTPDAGGGPVEGAFGFTAKAVTPAILFGNVAGKVERVSPGYMKGSDAQFAVTMTDAQYADIVALLAAWDARTGNNRYNLNTRNCVTFVKEAARRVGLAGLDRPKLMKRPRSYLHAVETANAGRVVHVGLHGDAWLTGKRADAAAAPAPPIPAS